MTVAGNEEDESVRQTFELEGEGDPVQQYLFRSPTGDRQWVFYWHYTLPPPEDDSLSVGQKLYQRLRRRPSSVTIEVFAPAKSQDDAEFARELVQHIDTALADHLGPTAQRGNRRLPVTVVEPARVPQLN